MSNENIEPVDFTQLADFILLGCIYKPYAELNFSVQRAVADPGFRLRFSYWQHHKGRSAFATIERGRHRGPNVVQLHRGNTTPK